MEREEQLDKAYRTLVAGFKRLGPEEKANLSWHLDQGTPILCGVKSAFFSDWRGAG